MLFVKVLPFMPGGWCKGTLSSVAQKVQRKENVMKKALRSLMVFGVLAMLTMAGCGEEGLSIEASSRARGIYS